MFWDIVALLFLAASIGQLVYLLPLGALSKTGKAYDFEKVPQKSFLPVSVIICARNEAGNLKKNLESILTQDYSEKGRPLFETIVVNDCSDDDTAAVLEKFSKKHSHLHIITITADVDRNFPGKKFALSQGVAAAVHDYLLLTDADCSAAGRHWIRQMISPFLAGKEIVAGYGAYRVADNVLNRFIRCETVFTFLQLHGLALLDMPYMAVGRNLAVKKTLLIAAQQSKLWKLSPSGDDDLLIRLFGTAKNFTANTNPESFTYSDAKHNFQDYVHQKQRHLSTGKYYKPAIKFWLGMNGFCHAMFWCTLPFIIVGMILQKQFPISDLALLIIFALRCIYFYVNMLVWNERLQEKRLMLFTPIFDCLLAGYNILFSPYILWKTKQRWK